MGSQTSKFISGQNFVFLHAYYPDFVHSLATESLLGYKFRVIFSIRQMTYCSIYYTLSKYHKPLIDYVILTIQRPIRKSKRKDQINLEQQDLLKPGAVLQKGTGFKVSRLSGCGK